MRSTPARVAVLDWRSGMEQRVCRSTLAVEASHLADVVDAVDWATMVLRDVIQPHVRLSNWQAEVARTPRCWTAGAKSVYGHHMEEGTSKSKGKRMAIEGALLR